MNPEITFDWFPVSKAENSLLIQLTLDSNRMMKSRHTHTHTHTQISPIACSIINCKLAYRLSAAGRFHVHFVLSRRAGPAEILLHRQASTVNAHTHTHTHMNTQFSEIYTKTALSHTLRHVA